MSKMLLVIDNYDSFTYNLVQYLGEILGGNDELMVYRNDKITPSQIEAINPKAIIISPGPGRPVDGGVSNDVIKIFGHKLPILGVCLGHQCMGYVFGAKIVRAKRLMHGKTSLIYHDGQKIYAGVKNPFIATRYHSLIIKRDTLPDCFKITAWTDEEEIMGIRHLEFPLEGLQFHPESILTKVGKNILSNFLRGIAQSG